MNRPARRVAFVSAVVLALLALAAPPAAAQVSLTTLGVPYTQNFDSLSNTGTTNPWVDDTTIKGWYATQTAGTLSTYRADNGGSNTGALYSYGSTGSTERALGSAASGTPQNIIYGARFVNNTGSPITSVDIAYTGEQWRNGGNNSAQTLAFTYQVANAGAITGINNPTTGWTTVAGSPLDFVTPITGATAAALDGNAAANRTARSATISFGTPVAVGQEIWIRWFDTNDSGNDHGVSVDDFSLTPQGGGPVTPALTINDVTLAEGNSGTTTFTFTVNLTAPAGAEGVTFDIATADGTATAPSDYTAKSVTGATIAAGNSTYTFDVLVNGDTTTEPNETFFVNVTNVAGATLADGQGLGTITNDDVSLTKIHDIQGPGASSPLAGASVTTTGVVTGVRSAGFYIQEPDAGVDADPLTSEGIYVYTGAAPPAAAAVGNLVQVTGTVSEYVPATDIYQPPLTELGSPTVSLLSTGNPLPTAVVLTATNPDPAGAYDQLERYEGMRVTVPSMTVVAPTQGTTNEPNATATTNGVFFGVVTGVPRPFREPGIQPPDPAPTGTIPPIPRFDGNPELIRVDSDVLTGTTPVNVATGAVLTNVTGPLDYTYRHYTILPETTPVPTGGMTATAVTTSTGSEFTIGSYNVERFYDTVDDAGVSDTVLTATAYANRLQKLSLGVRDYLKMPDILALCEVEKLPVLQAIAAKISTDAVAASEPDPQYAAYLVEGNDIGGIDVAFLVKQAIVTGTTPRVEVVSVTQALAGTLFTNLDNSTELLNDRPPLILKAIVHHANGASFPVTVIVNHLKAMTGVDDPGPGSKGWPTAGARDRSKRQKQAEDLAKLVQARQVADPTERIILVGDFNAYEFNDGYVDMVNVIAGTPTPDAQTVVTGDGVDLVNPDFVNLITTAPPAERYSYTYDGSAQAIDHVLVNAPVVAGTLARREEHPRINADFPATDRGNYGPATVTRLSDHEPVVSYYQVAAFATADVAVTATDAPDPVAAGTNLTYTITVANAGPDAAATASFSDTLPAGTTFVSLPAVGGWTCTTPAVGAAGTVSCSNPSFAAGSAVFTLTVAVAPSVTAGTVLSNTATATSAATDANPANNSATATTTVSVLSAAAVSATKTATGSFVAGSPVTYTIVLRNTGTAAQLDNPGNELTDVLPASLILVSATATSGTATATVATNTVTWNGSIPAGGTVTVTVVATISSTIAAGTTVSNQATISYDLNGDGVNEATGVTDDPATPAAGDATSFAAAAANGAVIPTLDGFGLGVLALLVALGGALVVGRRLS